MRLLLDENVPIAAVRALRSAGHDVVHVVEVLKSANDEIVLAHATSEQRVLVSFDRDFGTLVFARDLPTPAGIVLLRLVPRSADEISDMLVELMGDEKRRWLETFSVIERDRVRQRPLRLARE